MATVRNLVGACLVLFASTASGQQAKKYVPKDVMKDNAVWTWQLLDNKGQSINKGRLRGTADGKIIWTNGKQVGSWKKAEKDGMKIEFTASTLKGIAEMKAVPAVRPTYQGELTQSDGKFVLRLELVKD